jgi:hypothetical protein
MEQFEREVKHVKGRYEVSLPWRSDFKPGVLLNNELCGTAGDLDEPSIPPAPRTQSDKVIVEPDTSGLQPDEPEANSAPRVSRFGRLVVPPKRLGAVVTEISIL